jgi:alanyl-tRNA synthetase
MKAEEVRQVFLDFFASKGHHIAQPSSLIVQGDPTLLFTNAGMNPFKDLFLGNRTPDFRRVADTQPCLRVSGKHNDLEDVGKDTYHHTLFEMLGNWSFGDYFKEEAIAWAWELLTGPYGLPKDRLYVTYFEGDASEDLEADHQARSYWKQWIAEDRILPGNKKDNFWEMGDTGPCGPCSEIHMDLRSEEERKGQDARELVNKDHPQVIELWNLVFMEYQRMADGRLQTLPARHVDTGMGFERLCRAVAGASSNYDTDVFTPLLRQIEAFSGHRYGIGNEAVDIAMRVVADHLRAVCLVIADGQLPSNAKAGYVCRRILRRAIRYGYTYLGFEEPTLHRLVDTVVDGLGAVLPQLVREKNLIVQTLQAEEANFLRTLAKGLQRMDQWMSAQSSSHIAPQGTLMDGETAFELFDTYGFPPDLIALVLTEKGFGMDQAGFEKAMQVQKDRSRSATRLVAGDWQWMEWTEGDTALESQFVGYDQLECTSRLLRQRLVRSGEAEHAQVVLEITPFYAESGGQVGDTGRLVGEDGEVLDVLDVFKENHVWIHRVNRLPLHPEQLFQAVVDVQRRQSTSAHHSATHLLHTALHHHLGQHVQQKGSLVSPHQLRFDFAHTGRVTDQQMQAIVFEVNEAVRRALPLEESRKVPIREALDQGATALFGEKYGDSVRVISFGGTYSMELCGGTHVEHTGRIGFFRVVSESAVASGIRRIEAVCGTYAEAWVEERLHLLEQIKGLYKNPVDLLSQVGKSLDELVQLRKKMDEWDQKKTDALVQEAFKSFETMDQGFPVLVQVCDVSKSESLKAMAIKLRAHDPEARILLGAVVEDRFFACLALGDAASKRHNAGQILRGMLTTMGGQGGGQPHLAMGSATWPPASHPPTAESLRLALNQALQPMN